MCAVVVTTLVPRGSLAQSTTAALALLLLLSAQTPAQTPVQRLAKGAQGSGSGPHATVAAVPDAAAPTSTAGDGGSGISGGAAASSGALRRPAPAAVDAPPRSAADSSTSAASSASRRTSPRRMLGPEVRRRGSSPEGDLSSDDAEGSTGAARRRDSGNRSDAPVGVSAATANASDGDWLPYVSGAFSAGGLKDWTSGAAWIRTQHAGGGDNSGGGGVSSSMRVLLGTPGAARCNQSATPPADAGCDDGGGDVSNGHAQMTPWAADSGNAAGASNGPPDADAEGGLPDGAAFQSYAAKIQCELNLDPALGFMSFDALSAPDDAPPLPPPVSLPQRASPSPSPPPPPPMGRAQQPSGNGSKGSLAAIGLLISASRQDRSRCTGTLISQCHVLTAGHCVYGFKDETNGTDGGGGGGDEGRKWAFSPGWDGLRAPFGQFPSHTAVVPRQLVQDNDPSYDIGVVVLTQNVPSAAGPFFELDDVSGAVATVGLASADVGTTGSEPAGCGGATSGGTSGGGAGGSCATDAAGSSGDGDGGSSPTYRVQVIDGDAVIVSKPPDSSDGGGGGDAPPAEVDGGGGGSDAGDLGAEEPCLNFAGYASRSTLWAEYCRYLADLDDNFVETSCKGRPGVSGGPLWVYEPPPAGGGNTTVRGVPAAAGAGAGSGNTTASPTAAAVSAAPGAAEVPLAGTEPDPEGGRRVVRGVLTAGVPGGPTGAVRIDGAMRAWVLGTQQQHPCPA